MSVADAADENLAVHATWSCRSLPASRIDDGTDLVVVDSGLPCDTFNFVCRARLTPVTAPGRVAGAIAFFRQTGHPFSWWLGPGATPTSLPTILADAGLEPAEAELAMTLDLDRLPSQGPTPPGFTIQRVTTVDQLRAFARLSASNWSPPDDQVVRYFELAQEALVRSDAPQRLYVGVLEGRTVATAELTAGGGVVGLYNIATVPDCRGRGIGSAMTAFPLVEARRAGQTTAILQASAEGQGLYRRLGFAPFGDITEFKPV